MAVGTVQVTMRQVSGEHLEVVVRDTGIGITPAGAEQLFQPFTQAGHWTSRKFGGTGLGLAVSRGFCRIMGGDIELNSQLGVGSTFTMTVPLDAQRLNRQPSPARTPASGKT